MRVQHNGQLRPLSHEFIEKRIHEGFKPFRYKIPYRIREALETHSVYVSFYYRRQPYKIRISNHKSRSRFDLFILLKDNGTPQIETRIRRFLCEIIQKGEEVS